MNVHLNISGFLIQYTQFLKFFENQELVHFENVPYLCHLAPFDHIPVIFGHFPIIWLVHFIHFQRLTIHRSDKNSYLQVSDEYWCSIMYRWAYGWWCGTTTRQHFWNILEFVSEFELKMFRLQKDFYHMIRVLLSLLSMFQLVLSYSLRSILDDRSGRMFDLCNILCVTHPYLHNNIYILL